jgi:prepilin-type N-terminal cleavage/methylation domain-containing protein
MIAERAPSRRGFTLVELMVVVVLVGILASVGVVLFRNHVFNTRTVEAMAMMQSIRAAQEGWRAENSGYLDVSSSGTAWFPVDTPDRTLRNLFDPASTHPDLPKWRLLNPTTSGPIQFVYTVRAGAPLTQIPAPETQDKPTFPIASQQTEPWYLIQAKGDTDADGLVALYVATSLNAEVLKEAEGE